MGIFDLNEEATVIREPFLGSNLYYIDNFYKNPDAIVNMLCNTPSNLHHPRKDIIQYSLNGVYFEDRRHAIKNLEITPIYDHLSKICGQNPLHPYNDTILTNLMKFSRNDFNNYKDNYWHPHTDDGYTAIVYLNKFDDVYGTNLYKSVKPDLPETRGEHLDPWRSKENWEIITTLRPEYNRCVLFDGNKFTHGMHICDDRYFDDQCRLNQVFFFKENKQD